MDDEDDKTDAIGCLSCLLVLLAAAGVAGVGYGLSERSMWWVYALPFWGGPLAYAFIEVMAWATGLKDAIRKQKAKEKQ